MTSQLQAKVNNLTVEVTVREFRCPVAYLFGNGNAAYFDDNENQIYKSQLLGWKGLHIFRERFPQEKCLGYCDGHYPFKEEKEVHEQA